MRMALSGAFAAFFFAACFIPVDDYPEGAGTLGARCNADSRCLPDLECWDASANPGPVGGLCTKSCASNDECGENGVCMTYQGEKRCFLDCTYLSQETNKCGGRLDLACRFEIALPQSDACLPTCANDADCGNGFCNPESGLCADAPPTGGHNNMRCDDDDDCIGFCFLDEKFDTPRSLCGSWCTVGAPGACDPSLATGSARGACIAVGEANPVTGNGWACATECECHGDCLNTTDWVCDQGLVNGKHYCRLKAGVLDNGLDCPEQN